MDDGMSASVPMRRFPCPPTRSRFRVGATQPQRGSALLANAGATGSTLRETRPETSGPLTDVPLSRPSRSPSWTSATASAVHGRLHPDKAPRATRLPGRGDRPPRGAGMPPHGNDWHWRCNVSRRAVHVRVPVQLHVRRSARAGPGSFLGPSAHTGVVGTDHGAPPAHREQPPTLGPRVGAAQERGLGAATPCPWPERHSTETDSSRQILSHRQYLTSHRKIHFIYKC